MKYCDKCGRQIDDGAKFCKHCGNVVDEKSNGGGNKDKRINIKLIIGTIAGAAAAFFIVGLLFLNGIIGGNGDIDPQSDYQDTLAQEASETEEDTGFEAYYKSITDDEVVFENDTAYVDSQILITAADGTTKEQVEEIVKDQGGTVVGYISISNDYQIEFDESKTYNELEEIIEAWEQDDRFESVNLNQVFQASADSVDYRNDPWIDAYNASDTSGFEWSEVEPDGNNWWAEAIMMPSVWDMDVEFQPVKVGIYDSMFDTDNEDLDDKFIKIWNAPEDEDGNCMVSTLYESAENANRETLPYYHGSHVAGLIAADAENGFGIAGVSQNAELYGFSITARATDTASITTWGDLFEIKYCIAAMLNEGVRVINFSISFTEMLVAAQHGVDNAVKDLELTSSLMEKFLSKCLNAGYDFLIVKSSGNQNGYNWVECEKSEDYPYGYKKDETGEAEEDDTVYNADYDFMGAIDDENVIQHILIVGAAENHVDYYKTAYFSVVGKRVDVYAPGVDILSDLPTNITGLKSGTSMATPIVTGIASLVWGVNPNLSAEQVADIIKASVSVSMFDSEEVSTVFYKDTTPIVNAYFAVKLAMNLKTDTDGKTAEIGVITGMPYEIKEDGSANVLGGATVTVKDRDGNIVDTETATNAGGFSFVLPVGNYIITVEMPEYETETREVVLQKNDVINLNMELKIAEKTLNLYVCDYNSEEVISDARATIEDLSGNTYPFEITSDENGDIFFRWELPKGEYYVTAESEGYFSQTASVSLYENKIVKMLLNPEPEATPTPTPEDSYEVVTPAPESGSGGSASNSIIGTWEMQLNGETYLMQFTEDGRAISYEPDGRGGYTESPAYYRVNESSGILQILDEYGEELEEPWYYDLEGDTLTLIVGREYDITRVFTRVE